MSDLPAISVICPVFNEEKYIRQVIEFYINSKPENKELLIIDGGSTDSTVSIIKEYQQKRSDIKLLNNPDKYVPFALNAAIKIAMGDPIVRLDAHTKYADDYFLSILKAFEKSGADIVGGPMRATGEQPFQKAVARATSTAFGIGDSEFHDESKEGFVESVYLGAWKKSIFKDTGYFDEDLLRNQDDEFHYRAKSKGKTIYLDPAIKSWYSPRASYNSLYRQYYQYGLFKPLVLKKVSSGMRLRHLIPAGFVMYLCLLVFVCYFPILLLPGLLYMVLDVLFSFRYGDDFKVKILMLAVYPILHISYGLGFIEGQILLWMGKKPSI